MVQTPDQGENSFTIFFHGRMVNGVDREQQAQQTDDLLQRLVDGADNIGLFTLDSSGLFTNWNPGAERLFTHPAEQIIGQHFCVLFTAEDRQAGAPQQDMNTVRNEGRAISTRWYLRQDGARLWGSSVLAALGNDVSTGYGCIIHDLTAHKLEQDALQEMINRDKKLF